MMQGDRDAIGCGWYSAALTSVESTRHDKSSEDDLLESLDVNSNENVSK